ncbi:MAG: hypothetical protein EOO03_02945 [Chitinophagaceae bacterium]|nr:MAG: hypothetical protein EOO03_02945 [Chitinophagaceae bacterium]
MKQKFTASLLLLFYGIMLNAQHVKININKTEWLIPDITQFKFSENDTVQTSQGIFINRNQLQKFVLPGYKIPSLTDIKELLAGMKGERNTNGGKTADSAYLSALFSFQLNGIYFDRIKAVRGAGYMTSFYTSTDTLWKFDTSALKPAQVALHIYRNGNSSINIEPTYANLRNGEMFCNLLLLRKEEN